jgi:hypothetical protein
MVAVRVHAGQVDKQGEPYLLHVLRVVEAVSNEAKVVAALHDCIEDGGDDGLRAVLSLDLSRREGEAVKLLTHPARMGYANYVESIAEADNPLAREVKLADLRDNLGRIPHPNPEVHGESSEAMTWEPLRRRYEQAIAVLTAALPDEPRSADEVEAAKRYREGRFQ